MGRRHLPLWLDAAPFALGLLSVGLLFLGRAIAHGAEVIDRSHDQED